MKNSPLMQPLSFIFSYNYNKLPKDDAEVSFKFGVKGKIIGNIIIFSGLFSVFSSLTLM